MFRFVIVALLLGIFILVGGSPVILGAFGIGVLAVPFIVKVVVWTAGAFGAAVTLYVVAGTIWRWRHRAYLWPFDLRRSNVRSTPIRRCDYLVSRSTVGKASLKHEGRSLFLVMTKLHKPVFFGTRAEAERFFDNHRQDVFQKHDARRLHDAQRLLTPTAKPY